VVSMRHTQVKRMGYDGRHGGSATSKPEGVMPFLLGEGN
jgi:hypothetical protein